MLQMLELFFFYDRKRVKQVLEGKKLLAHYTTADTAMKIIKGRSLWLRNAGMMNDYMEIEHGKAAIEPVLNGPLGVRLSNVLNDLEDGLACQVIERHYHHREHARESIFMTSLSEHDPDDTLGRLSMWRAYGGPVSGVAVLFKGAVVNLDLEPNLHLTANPILYGGPDEFRIEFEGMVSQLEANAAFLKEFDSATILNACSAVLQFAMLSIKHLGFAEEREWRIVHRPYEFSSAHMISQTVSVGGIPQTIYDLPFHNPEKHALFNLPQLNLNEILEGIIIGPCHYPETVFRAFKDEMTAAGIENAQERIHVSNIPLRQQW